MKSRSSRLTLTGSRACGPWPEPLSITSSAPLSSASAIPRALPVIASREPWITSEGHCMRRARSRTVSGGIQSSTSMSISVCGVVSSPHPTQSSIALVECGSLNICEKKNSRKPR